MRSYETRVTTKPRDFSFTASFQFLALLNLAVAVLGRSHHHRRAQVAMTVGSEHWPVTPAPAPVPVFFLVLIPGPPGPWFPPPFFSLYLFLTAPT